MSVFERDDKIGGLMTYGIPDFKFAKWRVARRVEQLRQEGIEFETDRRRRDMSLAAARNFDAVCLTIGAQRPLEVPLPGRHLDGVVTRWSFSYRRIAGRQAAPRRKSATREARTSSCSVAVIPARIVSRPRAGRVRSRSCR